MAYDRAWLEQWCSEYDFTDNGTASNDIFKQVIGRIPDHKTTFGPTENGGYYIKLEGSNIDETFEIS